MCRSISGVCIKYSEFLDLDSMLLYPPPFGASIDAYLARPRRLRRLDLSRTTF